MADAEYNSDIDWAEIDAANERNSAQLRSNEQIAQGGWAVQKKQIAAQLKIARMNHRLQLKHLREIGIPMRELAEREQAFNEEQAKWARGFAQAQLGLEYMKWQSSLSGPGDWMQAYNFARNARSNPNVPVYLQGLLDNVQQAGFSGYAGTPDAQTAESIQQKLTGAGPGAADSEAAQQAAIAAAGQIFQRGPGSLAPGVLESLDEHELATLASIGGGLGNDVPRWLRDYQRKALGGEDVRMV
jgi:hypothetical protein